MSDSVRPQRQQPTRLPHPWDSPGKNTGVGCHFLLQCIKVKSESEVAQSCPTLVTPWTAAHQAPPSMGFSRQDYWSGVPLPSLHIYPWRAPTQLFLFNSINLFTMRSSLTTEKNLAKNLLCFSNTFLIPQSSCPNLALIYVDLLSSLAL